MGWKLCVMCFGFLSEEEYRVSGARENAVLYKVLQVVITILEVT